MASLVRLVKATVHFGYKGHIGPEGSVPYIRLSLISEGSFRVSSI